MYAGRALFSLAINLLGSFLALLLDILLANNMSADEYGYFRYLYTIVVVASTFSLFGAGQYLIKVTARHGTSRRAKKELSVSYLCCSLACVIVSIILLILQKSSFLKIEGDVITILSLLLFWMWVRNLFQIFRAIAVGAEFFVRAQLSDRFVLNAVPLLACLLMVHFEVPLSYEMLLFFSIAATFISLIVVFSEWHATRCFVRVDISTVRSRLGRLAYIAFGEGTDAFLRLGILAVLGSTLPFRDVAAFAIMLRLTDALGTIQTAANAIYTPKIVKELRETRFPRLRSAQSCAIFTSFFVLVAFAIILFFGDVVLSLFGPSYVEFKSALVLMVGCFLLKSIMGPTSVVLVMNNNAKDLFFINVVFSLLVIVAGYFSSKVYGFWGAVYLYVAVIVSQSLALAALAYYRVGSYLGVDLRTALGMVK